MTTTLSLAGTRARDFAGEVGIDDERRGFGVREQGIELARAKHREGGDRDRARPLHAQPRRRERGAVGHAQQHPVARLDARVAEHVRDLRDAAGEFAVRERPVGRRDRCLVGEGRQMTIDELDHRLSIGAYPRCAAADRSGQASTGGRACVSSIRTGIAADSSPGGLRVTVGQFPESYEHEFADAARARHRHDGRGPRDCRCAAGPAPVPRAGTDVVAVDFYAVDKDGNPVLGLKPEELALRVGKESRPIRSLETIRVAPGEDVDAPKPPAERTPIAYGSNLPSDAGRMVFLLFDHEGMSPGDEQAAKTAIPAFLNQLSPRDRVGLVTFPRGKVEVDLTTDSSQTAGRIA